MDPPEIPSPPATKREIQLQGPRPTPLRVSKDSHKIKKPPIAPPKLPPHPHAPPYNPPQNPPENQPVIIYSVSPKPIHVDASNFMSIVQRLTGLASSSSSSPAPAAVAEAAEMPVSPAARLAALERTSPTAADRRRREGVEGIGDLEMGGGQMPGILSPAPANLPAVWPGVFSPAAEGHTLFGGSELLMSPFNSFLMSPSSLFFNGASINVSPSPSPGEFFNIFDF